uniref:Uncharacterized protein n=1 Tax=Strix occidentalis caurina TaxID=311401 RepID=A0A8D0EJM7_STROC
MTASPALKSNQWIINEDKGEGNGDTTTDSESEFETTLKKTSDHQRSVSCRSRNKFEFDDERTWSDLDENYVNSDLPEKYTKTPLQMDFSSKNDTTIPDKAIKRKVASKKGDEMSKESAVDSDSNGPPVSNLMMKLFPSLKPKQKTGCHLERAIKSNVEQEPGGERTGRKC